jgi:hypothetical protein
MAKPRAQQRTTSDVCAQVWTENNAGGSAQGTNTTNKIVFNWMYCYRWIDWIPSPLTMIRFPYVKGKVSIADVLLSVAPGDWPWRLAMASPASMANPRAQQITVTRNSARLLSLIATFRLVTKEQSQQINYRQGRSRAKRSRVITSYRPPIYKIEKCSYEPTSIFYLNHTRLNIAFAINLCCVPDICKHLMRVIGMSPWSFLCGPVCCKAQLITTEFTTI